MVAPVLAAGALVVLTVPLAFALSSHVGQQCPFPVGLITLGVVVSSAVSRAIVAQWLEVVRQQSTPSAGKARWREILCGSHRKHAELRAEQRLQEQCVALSQAQTERDLLQSRVERYALQLEAVGAQRLASEERAAVAEASLAQLQAEREHLETKAGWSAAVRVSAGQVEQLRVLRSQKLASEKRAAAAEAALVQAQAERECLRAKVGRLEARVAEAADAEAIADQRRIALEAECERLRGSQKDRVREKEDILSSLLARAQRLEEDNALLEEQQKLQTRITLELTGQLRAAGRSHHKLRTQCLASEQRATSAEAALPFARAELEALSEQLQSLRQGNRELESRCESMGGDKAVAEEQCTALRAERDELRDSHGFLAARLQATREELGAARAKRWEYFDLHAARYEELKATKGCGDPQPEPDGEADLQLLPEQVWTLQEQGIVLTDGSATLGEQTESPRSSAVEQKAVETLYGPHRTLRKCRFGGG